MKEIKLMEANISFDVGAINVICNNLQLIISHWIQLDMSIRTETRSPNLPGHKNYWAWA